MRDSISILPASYNGMHFAAGGVAVSDNLDGENCCVNFDLVLDNTRFGYASVARKLLIHVLGSTPYQTTPVTMGRFQAIVPSRFIEVFDTAQLEVSGYGTGANYFALRIGGTRYECTAMIGIPAVTQI